MTQITLYYRSKKPSYTLSSIIIRSIYVLPSDNCKISFRRKRNSFNFLFQSFLNRLFYVVIQITRDLLYFFKSIYYICIQGVEEDVSSAEEQLTSNKLPALRRNTLRDRTLVLSLFSCHGYRYMAKKTFYSVLRHKSYMNNLLSVNRISPITYSFSVL